MAFGFINRFFKTASNNQYAEIQVQISKKSYGFAVYAYSGKRWVAKMDCLINEDSSILICDIQHSTHAYNQGYGSAIMDRLNTYAAENGYTHIWGNLSKVDSDYQDRLHHFYQKHGFQVTVYEEPTGIYYGRIDKYL